MNGMKEREQISQIPKVEIQQLSQSEFLSELEKARFRLTESRLTERVQAIVDEIRTVDRLRLGVDEAILDNQIVRYFREDSFDEKGEKISSRLYFESEPKKEIGFKK